MLIGGYGNFCEPCEIPRQSQDPRTRAELRSGAVGHVMEGSVPPVDEPREVFEATGSMNEAGFTDDEVKTLRACAAANLCGRCFEVKATADNIAAAAI